MKEDKQDQGHYWQTFDHTEEKRLTRFTCWRVCEQHKEYCAGLEEGYQFWPNTLQLKTIKVKLFHNMNVNFLLLYTAYIL